MRLSASRDVDLLGSAEREVALAAAFGPDYMAGMTYFSLNGWLRDGVGRELVFSRGSEAVHPESGETVGVDVPIFMTFYEEAGGGE